MEIEFETILTVAVGTLIVSIFLRDFHKSKKAADEMNRAVEARFKLQAERKERGRVSEENYRRQGKLLKKTVLDALQSIERGERRGLDFEAIEAVIALRARDGDHPEIKNAWDPIMEELKGEIVDGTAMRDRINDLLYPDALEDVEALKSTIFNGLNEDWRAALSDREFIEANATIRKINARDARIKQQNLEAEIESFRMQKQKDQKYREASGENTRGSIRSIAQMYGMPANSFDHLTSIEAIIIITTIRKLHESTGRDIKECAQFYLNEVRPDELISKINEKTNSQTAPASAPPP